MSALRDAIEAEFNRLTALCAEKDARIAELEKQIERMLNVALAPPQTGDPT